MCSVKAVPTKWHHCIHFNGSKWLHKQVCSPNSPTRGHNYWASYETFNAHVLVKIADLNLSRLLLPFPRVNLKKTMEEFYHHGARVAEGLLQGLSAFLNLPRGHFGPSFEPHTSYLRLNYYPVCPEPCGMLSVNRHSDAGALTVLLQEKNTTALQVQRAAKLCDIAPDLASRMLTQATSATSVSIGTTSRDVMHRS